MRALVYHVLQTVSPVLRLEKTIGHHYFIDSLGDTCMYRKIHQFGSKT